MIRTFQALRHVDPGFAHPEQVLTIGLGIPETQVKDPVAVIRIEQAIMEKVAAVPGVVSVGLTSTVPMSGSGWHDPIFAEDKKYESSQIPPLRLLDFVLPAV